MKILKILWLGLFFIGFSFAQENKVQENKNISLTVYNQNFGLVKDVRGIEMKKGDNLIKISDVAALIEPESVRFKSLTDPEGSFILEQNFEYDLVNPDKLLGKYIDREIRVITKDNNVYDGMLSSYDAGYLILTKEAGNGPVFMVSRENIRDVEFGHLPEGLITKPTLVWQVENNKEGPQKLEIDYITNGINWLADYVATISKDEKNLSLNSWVTIDNKSGATYENAALKLVAGEVHRIEQQPLLEETKALNYGAAREAAAAQFEEKPFFEYHIYTLDRKTTIKNNQIKQISLFQSSSVPIKKVYTYDGAMYRWYYYNNWKSQPYNKNIDVNIEFENSKKNSLGIPLPKGKVRVYKADTDGSLQFIGEDMIDHTPKDEKVSLSLGKVFDVVGERKVTDHKVISGNIYRDSYEITLRNHKKEPVTIGVIEHQFGDWDIINNSAPYEKIDANTIKFTITVDPDKEAVVTYTSEYKF